jgi:hypothetical protein
MSRAGAASNSPNGLVMSIGEKEARKMVIKIIRGAVIALVMSGVLALLAVECTAVARGGGARSGGGSESNVSAGDKNSDKNRGPERSNDKRYFRHFAQLPDYCIPDNTAAGATVGGAVGGLSGAEADAQCQEAATQIAYQQAAAQQAAIQQQIDEEAAQQSGTIDLPAAAYEPVSTDYKTPSNGHQHRITVRRLNSFSEPAAHQVCDTFTKIDADLISFTGTTATARRCRGPDGEWHDAS